MVSVTLSITKEFKEELRQFPWINWSEIAREEILKKIIFENYIKTAKLTDEEWDFCEKNDWHPADELPFKKEYIKKINIRKNEQSLRLKNVDDIFR